MLFVDLKKYPELASTGALYVVMYYYTMPADSRQPTFLIFTQLMLSPKAVSPNKFHVRTYVEAHPGPQEVKMQICSLEEKTHFQVHFNNRLTRDFTLKKGLILVTVSGKPPTYKMIFLQLWSNVAFIMCNFFPV